MTSSDRMVVKQLIDRRVRELVADEEDRCVGCGANYDSQTYGCRTCMYRHYNRTRRPATCSKCGCRYQERTTGCPACRERHKARRRRGKMAA